MSELTHIDERGEARMVDVGEKPKTVRKAIARGRVRLGPESYDQLAAGEVEKGDVLAAARIAGIMAAKRTPDLIPLCHHVALSSVKVDLTLSEADRSVRIIAEAHASDRTGVEMEALTAVSVAALTIYDMLKAVDRSMVIEGVELLEKSGGRSGHYRRPVSVVRMETPPPRPAPQPKPATPPRRIRPRSEPTTPSPGARAVVGDVCDLSVDDPTLLAYLRADALDSAYMLGDLDQPYAEHGRWFGLRDDDGALRALLLLYTGLSKPAVLTSGAADDVEALLTAARATLPRHFYAHIREHHHGPLSVLYEVREPKRMLRMGLRKPDYRAIGDPAGVEPLSHRDTGAMMRLYRYYPDNFFEPALLDTGLYFGVREGHELVSVAGIHVLSEKNNVAAIGNIVTHGEHRGSGLATRCVRRLLDELFERVDGVALNVECDNTSALTCYGKFGFTTRYEFIEGHASLR